MLPHVEPALGVVWQQHAPERAAQAVHVDEQEERQEDQGEDRQADGERGACDPEQGVDRIRDRARQVRAALLDVLGRARIAEPGQLTRVAEVGDEVGQGLQEVPQRPHHRHEQHEREHGHGDRGPEHEDGRGEAAAPAGLADEPAERDLEDERPEHAQEDDEERVPDRDDRRCEGNDDGGRDQDAPGHRLPPGVRLPT